MIKHLLPALALSLAFGINAQAQTTTPNTPTGNRTAGTTEAPVDPTSKTGQQISGATGNGAANTDTDTAPVAPGTTTPRTPTGNRTAGTTSQPIDPTSKVGQEIKGAPGTDTNRKTRKATKTKTKMPR
ncbi:hypothetical protein [Hymenobacter arizonensis]|uniref:Uncharacterized protein n=1 Tax=Hymenobacter arizonensis TaxID=1227077 RepID=A0A1I5UVB4_HYMAR|nr:hypothetical protein [Hymenobacter arizonensis]SFP98656.1 hypothetical protein SAMN04515668_1070 [Hymenobacter arizonensis]